MSYEHNIFWSDIPKDAKIYDLGQSWVVHMPDGRKGLVYWTGQDSAKAQAMLKARALPKGMMPGPPANLPNFRNAVKTACGRWRWDGHPGDTCVCGVPKDGHKTAKKRDSIAKHAPKPPETSSGVCTIVCKFPRRH